MSEILNNRYRGMPGKTGCAGKTENISHFLICGTIYMAFQESYFFNLFLDSIKREDADVSRNLISW
jgi:hypothetical protein